MDTIHFKNGSGPSKAQRCGYCHDDFGGELAAFCPLCDSRLHLDCLAELQRCPTLGCGAKFKRSGALPPVTEETRARRQRFLELRARELSVAPSLIRRDGTETGLTLGQHLQEFPADLTGVEYPGIDLRRYELEDGLFRGALLEDGNFSGARMSRGQFQGARLRSTDFRHALVVNGAFQEACLEGSDLRSGRFRGAKFQSAEMKSVKASGGNFERACFDDVKAADAVFRQGQLQETQWLRGRLRGVDFREADLTRADFAGAELTGANFAGASLKGVNFKGASLQGANFSETDLSVCSFEGAVYDRTTLWPKTGMMTRFRPNRYGARLERS